MATTEQERNNALIAHILQEIALIYQEIQDLKDIVRHLEEQIDSIKARGNL